MFLYTYKVKQRLLVQAKLVCGKISENTRLVDKIRQGSVVIAQQLNLDRSMEHSIVGVGVFTILQNPKQKQCGIALY